jgi:hypothetical protein
MSVTKTQLIGGSFQDAEGNLLENGYLELKLSQDGSVAGIGNICSGIKITIQLDSQGNTASSTSTPAAPNQYVWANGSIAPINTFYKVTGYTSAGQKAWGPNNQQVGVGSVFNLDSWVPNSVISWFPSVQTTVFSVNGVLASSQSDINLEQGANITITDEGNGNIQISATGGGGLSGNGAFFFGPGITEAGLTAIGQPWNISQVSNVVNENIVPSGTVILALFELQADFTISKCSQTSNSNEVGFTTAFGIYSYAGELLVNGGSFDPKSSYGVQTNTFTPVTLTSGNTYWLAWATNTADAEGNWLGMQWVTQGVANILCANSTRFATAANLASSGPNDPHGNPTTVLPATLGALTPWVPNVSDDDGFMCPLWE